MLVNNPKRDFKDGMDYLFALHYEDKVYALSQPVTLGGLQVVKIGSDDTLRSTPFQATSRGRGVRRSAERATAMLESSLFAHGRGEDEALGNEQMNLDGPRPTRRASKAKVDMDERGMHAVRQEESDKDKETAPAMPPKKRLHDMVFSDEGDEEEESWMFKCLCGVHKMNYDDGRPMVECEKCGTWQHAACAGLDDDND